MSKRYPYICVLYKDKYKKLEEQKFDYQKDAINWFKKTYFNIANNQPSKIELEIFTNGWTLTLEFINPKTRKRERYDWRKVGCC